jgi:hypothetical protein
LKQKTMLNEEANLLPLGIVRGPRRLELAMHPRRRLSAQGARPWAWGERVQGSLERSPAITADEREQDTRIGWYASLRHNLRFSHENTLIMSGRGRPVNRRISP